MAQYDEAYLRKMAEETAYTQKLAYGATGNGYDAINKVAVDTPDSPLLTMARAIEHTNELCSRVAMLAIKLVGPEPTDAGQRAGSAPTPQAILPALEQAARDLRQRVESAMYELNRIERSLP